MWKVIRLNNHGSKCMVVKRISTCILMYALFKPISIIIDRVLRFVKNFLDTSRGSAINGFVPLIDDAGYFIPIIHTQIIGFL